MLAKASQTVKRWFTLSVVGGEGEGERAAAAGGRGSVASASNSERSEWSGVAGEETYVRWIMEGTSADPLQVSPVWSSLVPCALQ